MTVGTRPRKGSARRFAAVGVAMAMSLALLPGAANAARSNTDELSATDNIGAAIAWSDYTFQSANQAAIGRDDVFADNLASGLIQGLGTGVPLLLTDTDSLDARVDAELTRLGVQSVHILGGTAAISQSVEDAIVAKGLAVHRHAGATRVETAIDIASKHAAAATSALVARSTAGAGDPTQAFADALAAGAWAAEDDVPVLLTQSNELNDNLEAYLSSSAIEDVTIIGGTAAVSAAVASAIEALGITVDRVSGATRFDTAVAIAKARGFDDAGDATDGVILVEGQAANSWADGFAAAAFAANPKPIVLSNGDDLPTATETFLAGGDASTLLVCGPFTSTAACDEAADILGQAVAGVVSLAATAVEVGQAIEGTVSPATNVTSVSVAGPCVTDGTVALTNGSFSVPTTATEAGSCTVTFTVTHSDGNTTTQTFTVTVTAPSTVTDAPELVNVAVQSLSTNTAILRFVFDEPITASSVAAGDFWLYGPDNDNDQFVANDAVRDPSNENTVLAQFDRDDYDAATTAAVAEDSVSDIDGNTNPPASKALKSVAYGAGRTSAPDLVSVGNVTDVSGNSDAFTVTFTWDEDAELVAATDETGYVLVVNVSGGVTTIPGTAASLDGDGTKIHEVEFDINDATPTAVTRSQAKSGLRRAYVEADTVSDNTDCVLGDCNYLQSANVASGGTTNVPDLVSVTPDYTHGARVVFKFDETVSSDAGDLDETEFYVLYFDGEVVAANSVTRISNTEVRATYDDGTVNRAIVGGIVGAGAVVGNNGDNEPQSVGIAQSFAAGSVLGPQLVSASASEEASLPGGTEDTFEVLYTFDVAVDAAVANGSFFVYLMDGTAVDNATNNNDCVRQTDKTKVLCSFDISVDDTLALAAVGYGAVDTEDNVITVQISGIEGNVKL